MELKIVNKKEDPLLSRTKFEVDVVFEKATPSRAEIKNKLATDLGKDGKLIVVKGIYTTRGLKKAKNISYVYENEEALKRIEIQKEGKKKEAKEEVKAEKPEAKKEEKAEEKPEGKKKAKQEEKPKEQKDAKKDEQKPKGQAKDKK